MGLKMKNVNIMGVHKKTIYMENCLKRRALGQFAGAWQKIGRVLLRGAGVGRYLDEH